MKYSQALVGLGAAALATGPAVAWGTETRVVAVTGQAAPGGGNGVFATFFRPALNDAGQAAFEATLSGTGGGSADNEGVFRGNGLSATEQLFRKGQPAPDGNGFYLSLGSPMLNAAGQAMIFTSLGGTAGGSTDDFGIFRADGPAARARIAREGQAVPGGNGTFLALSGPTLNNAGQVAFTATLTGTSGGSANDNGGYRSDGTSIVELVREGQPAPDGNGTFLNIGVDGINDAGQVAFFAGLSGTSGGGADNRGLFRADGVAPPVQIVRTAQSAPDGDGFFLAVGPALINNAGQVLFYANIGGASGGTANDNGIFRGDGGGGPIVTILRAGTPAPDGNGIFDTFATYALNDAGESAFVANLAGTSGGSADNSGVFRAAAAGGGIVQIARDGQPGPDGIGVFDSFNEIAFNDLGQTAFNSGLVDASGTRIERGIYFDDGAGGLYTVVRAGDALLGSTVEDFRFAARESFSAEGPSGMNNLGQVAYQFVLADGREGVAIWSVPEPGAVSILALGVLALRRRR